MKKMKVSGMIVDIHRQEIIPGEVHVQEGRITHINNTKEGQVPGQYILPGFIDAHIHIESSMMVPAEFARLAVRHGTVATVSDPHEIANVLGISGVDYMIENGNQVPFKFYFGAPSCVPATSFETAGSEINVSEIKRLMVRPEIKYLAEMMNWPGVLNRDDDVMGKIQAARNAGKPIDGHAPGLTGKDAMHYADAGITTDHECSTLKEALDKINAGMKIIIREGSAARNFDALIPLMADYPEKLMFCSDDKHPDELVEGHINEMAIRAIYEGYDLFDVLRAACLHPVDHYGLDVGLLRVGDSADFIVVDDLDHFNVRATFIDGIKVYDKKQVLFPRPNSHVVNSFHCDLITCDDLVVRDSGEVLNVIEAKEGQLITGSLVEPVKRNCSGEILTDTARDILKIVVVNRYKTAVPAVAFIKGFGLKTGALASTVAHDSHNIIAVGVDDDSIIRAVNRLIKEHGGICTVSKDEVLCLSLPVAGLMSTVEGTEVAAQYQQLDKEAKLLGSGLSAPFMTLSFMALLVIPALKLSDRGLFDGQSFEFVQRVC